MCVHVCVCLHMCVFTFCHTWLHSCLDHEASSLLLGVLSCRDCARSTRDQDTPYSGTTRFASDHVLQNLATRERFKVRQIDPSIQVTCR